MDSQVRRAEADLNAHLELIETELRVQQKLNQQVNEKHGNVTRELARCEREFKDLTKEELHRVSEEKLVVSRCEETEELLNELQKQTIALIELERKSQQASYSQVLTNVRDILQYKYQYDSVRLHGAVNALQNDCDD